jgi:enamine deaminase RidA (YjgF/YER057c/UK114 family)
MTSRLALVNPPTLERPLGYAHAVEVKSGRLLVIAGQIAHDRDGRMVGPGDLVAQFRQVCQNLEDIVEAAGGRLTDMARLTIFVVDVEDYKRKLEPIGVVYREFFGRHFPAMTVVEVRRLYVSSEGGLIEIQAEAVLP